MTPIKKTRRLLLVTPFFPSHGGGVERVAGELSRRLLAFDEGLQIEWLASSGDAFPAPTARLRARKLRVWNGIEARLGVPIPLPSPRALGLLWRAVRRCDALHLHDFAYPINLAAALFCRMQGKPYFITQHIGAVPFQQPLLRSLLCFLNATAGKSVLSCAATAVFISEKVRREFAIPGSVLVPNGVDTAIFCPDQPSDSSQPVPEFEPASDAPLILFLGRFVAKKGVPLLVELSHQMSGAQWIFAGRGPLDPSAEIGPNARVLQGLEGLQIAALCRAATVLVLPSRGEGFPLVVQESLACGLPVLVGDELGEASPAARPWLHLEAVGQADDAARWEKRLRALLDEIALDPEAEAQNRAARAAFARREWSWDACAAAYLAILEQIIPSN